MPPFVPTFVLVCAILQVAMDGACLYRSAWKTLEFEDDHRGLGAEACNTPAKELFTPYRLRLQIIHQMIKYCVIVSITIAFPPSFVPTFVPICHRVD